VLKGLEINARKPKGLTKNRLGKMKKGDYVAVDSNDDVVRTRVSQD
jgi:hypothetical protein